MDLHEPAAPEPPSDPDPLAAAAAGTPDAATPDAAEEAPPAAAAAEETEQQQQQEPLPPMTIDVESILEGSQMLSTARYTTEAEKTLERAWRSVGVASSVNSELLDAAVQRFDLLEPALKLRLLVSLLSLTPMQRHSMRAESIGALLAAAHADSDEWVRVVAAIVAPVRSAARLAAAPECPKMAATLAATARAVAQRAPAPDRTTTLPLEWAYLNRSLQPAATAGAATAGAATTTTTTAPEAVGGGDDAALPPLPPPTHGLFHVRQRPSPLEQLLPKKKTPPPQPSSLSSSQQLQQLQQQSQQSQQQQSQQQQQLRYSRELEVARGEERGSSPSPSPPRLYAGGGEKDPAKKKHKTDESRGKMMIMNMDELRDIRLGEEKRREMERKEREKEKEEARKKKEEAQPPAKKARKTERDADAGEPSDDDDAARRTKEELRAERKAAKKAERKAAKKAEKDAAAAAAAVLATTAAPAATEAAGAAAAAAAAAAQKGRKRSPAESPSASPVVAPADGRLLPPKRGKGRPRKTAAAPAAVGAGDALTALVAGDEAAAAAAAAAAPAEALPPPLSGLPAVITPRAAAPVVPAAAATAAVAPAGAQGAGVGVSVRPPPASAAEYKASTQALVAQALRQCQPAAAAAVAMPPEAPVAPAVEVPPAPEAAAPPPPQPPVQQPAEAPQTAAAATGGGGENSAAQQQQLKNEAITKATAVMAQLQQQPCNSLTEANRHLIWQFLMGSRQHVGESPVVTVPLNSETKRLGDGTTVTESIVFEMNYDTMTWKKLRKRLKV